MTTWSEVGGNPAPGEPHQIRTVANHFGDLSITARRARTQLAALQRGELQACWTGVAADAFAAELEILPADLSKLERSLDHASSALHTWARSLDSYQDQAESKLRTHGRAEADLDSARDARDRERRQAIEDGIIDPVGGIIDVITGNERMAPYERRVDDAKDYLRRTRDDIDQIRDDVNATARTVANLLDEASRLGIRNKDFFQKAAEFLEALGETLMAVLKFLDELVDLLAPWVGMALFILSFVNPAFAVAALAFAALDFGLTATRAALGDEDVTGKDLFDDGIDLALAMVGAKGAGAGIKGFQSLKGAHAASQTSRLVKMTDFAFDVVGGLKVTGDYYLNIADMVGVGPGSTFDMVFDVADGNTDSWAPDGGGNYGSDFIDASNELVDATSNLGEATADLLGIDLDSGSGPDIGPAPDPIVDPGPAPEPIIDPGPAPEPVIGITPDPAPDTGIGVTPGAGAEGGVDANFGITPDLIPDAGFAPADSSDFEVALAPPHLGADADVPLVADLPPATRVEGVFDAGTAAASAAPLAATTGDTSAGTAAVIGAGALGVASAAAGAKRLSDKRTDDEAEDSTPRAPHAAPTTGLVPDTAPHTAPDTTVFDLEEEATNE